VRAFISYSHDSAEHKNLVWDLCERLRNDGIDCRIDQQESSPPEGWPRWCRNQVQESQFVIVVSTETYERRYEGKDATGTGLGAKWEGFVITQDLYEAEGKNTKFIPVVFTPDDAQHIPLELRAATRYDLGIPEAYANLLRHLTKQPLHVKSEVAREIRRMPPLERKQHSPPGITRRRGSMYDVFLSYSHEEAEWVENLAKRLADDCAMEVWLDKWNLTPGGSWQQEMAKGLDEAKTCAVCIGKKTTTGWFREEVERALDLQTRTPGFRVIPVLLPEASAGAIPQFLSLKTWADFRRGQDDGYAFHVLVQGIRGEPIGRWPPGQAVGSGETVLEYQRKLAELKILRPHLHEEVALEFERKIMNGWYEGKR